jgi:hypothetical protein
MRSLRTTIKEVEMKRSIGRVFVLAVVSCSVAGLVSVGAYAGYLRQFAAQYLNFDGSEQSTTLAPPSGGQTIYRGTVMVSADVDTLEVTISATGDLLDSGVPATNSIWLNCQVDGNPCNGGTNSAGNSVAGWVPVLSLMAPAQVAEPTPTPTTPATATDNNIHYSWCMPIKPKRGGGDHLTHDVDLKMASGDGTHAVHIEQIHVFVDGAKFGGQNKLNACTPAAVPTPVP